MQDHVAGSKDEQSISGVSSYSEHDYVYMTQIICHHFQSSLHVNVCFLLSIATHAATGVLLFHLETVQREA